MAVERSGASRPPGIPRRPAIAPACGRPAGDRWRGGRVGRTPSGADRGACRGGSRCRRRCRSSAGRLGAPVCARGSRPGAGWLAAGLVAPGSSGGRARKSSAPASKARSRSGSWVFELSTMTGMSCCQGEASGSPLRIFAQQREGAGGVSSSPSTTSAGGSLPGQGGGVVGAAGELCRVVVGDELVNDRGGRGRRRPR